MVSIILAVTFIALFLAQVQCKLSYILHRAHRLAHLKPAAIIFDRCTRTYVVKPGDICDNISAMKGVSTLVFSIISFSILKDAIVSFQLASLNPDIDASCNNLTPGMVLCLETSNGGCPDVYIVKSHDTCDSVAAKFGISNNHLVSNNPQINSECTNIYDGEVRRGFPYVQ